MEPCRRRPATSSGEGELSQSTISTRPRYPEGRGRVSRLLRTPRRCQNRAAWARKTTVRPLTRTSTERTRSPRVCSTCFSIRRLRAVSAAGSERGSTVIELLGPEALSVDPFGPRNLPKTVVEGLDWAGPGRDADEAGGDDGDRSSVIEPRRVRPVDRGFADRPVGRPSEPASAGLVGYRLQHQWELRLGGLGTHSRLNRGSGGVGFPHGAWEGGEGGSRMTARARGPGGPRSRAGRRGSRHSGDHQERVVLLRLGGGRTRGGRRRGARCGSRRRRRGAGAAAGGTREGGSSGGAWSWPIASPALKTNPESPQAKELLTIAPSRSGNPPERHPCPSG